MPLTDLIRYVNSQIHYPVATKNDNIGPFFYTEGKVFLHYANLQLESVFLPVEETQTGRLFGHAAKLRVTGLGARSPLSPEAVFVLPTDDIEFIQLDRFVRTLHALNYLTQQVRGTLLLQVHQRHILGVASNHGLAFEEILKACGLKPESIILELEISNLDVEEHAKMLQAAENYRKRGYRLGIAHQKQNVSKLLLALNPDVIRIDARRSYLFGYNIFRQLGAVQNLAGKILLEGNPSPQTAAIQALDESGLRIDLIQSQTVLERPAQPWSVSHGYSERVHNPQAEWPAGWPEILRRNVA